MRSLIITDTHGLFNAAYEKSKDVLSYSNLDNVILLGDHSSTDVRCIMHEFGHLPIYRINGNHDTPNMVENDITIPFHNQVQSNPGLPSFIGWEGSHRYKPSQFYGFSQSEGTKLEKKMPSAKILFSHDGPFTKEKDDAHCGLKGISNYIKHKKPTTVIHGHLHKNYKNIIKTVDVYCVYGLAVFDFDINGQVLDYKTFWI